MYQNRINASTIILFHIKLLIRNIRTKINTKKWNFLNTSHSLDLQLLQLMFPQGKLILGTLSCFLWNFDILKRNYFRTKRDASFSISGDENPDELMDILVSLSGSYLHLKILLISSNICIKVVPLMSSNKLSWASWEWIGSQTKRNYENFVN